jgi:hypothetical protein
MIRQCRARSQSPVNIIRGAAIYNPDLDRIQVTNLNRAILYNVTNTQFTGITYIFTDYYSELKINFSYIF